MKNLSFLLMAGVCMCLGACTTTPKRVSILGDSYSTFYGWMTPETNLCYFGADTPDWHEGQDVTQVEHTWWWQAICNQSGYLLECNNSYSGSTLVNTPLMGMEVETSFISRACNLGTPDIILVCGGTNDYWNTRLERGEFQYANWTENDKKLFRPGTAYLLHSLQECYPKAQIYFILNEGLETIGEDICRICEQYHIPVIRPEGIDKCPDGHPTQAGMTTIAQSVLQHLK